MTKWLLLALAIIAETIATSALKSAEGFTRLIPSIIVVVGYVVSFGFLSLVLKDIPVGIAYAIWSGAGILLISLIGYFYFKQTMDFPAVIGIGYILPIK